MDSEGERASAVRTSIGLAHAHPEGGWTYTCPAQWGDDERALAARSEGGALTGTLGQGQLYRSRDDGCTFTLVDNPEGWHGLSLSAYAGRLWASATDGPGGEVGVGDIAR